MDTSKIRGFDETLEGPVTAKNIPKSVDVYMRNVIRNSILSELTNKNTKPWFAGTSSRFVSTEDLTEAGLDLDVNGELSPLRLADGDVNVLY